MASLQKNVAAQNVKFCLVNAATGAAMATATFTSSAWVTKDGGSQAGFAGTFTTLGNGQYNYAPTQAETNAADVGIMIAVSGAVPVHMDFHTDQVDANGLPKVDVEDIAGSATAAQALSQSANSICYGACSGGSTTTAVVSTLNNPASLTDAGQLIGRTIIFLGSSTTADVQAQSSTITGSTTGSTPTITFTLMTHAPASGDTFVIV